MRQHNRSDLFVKPLWVLFVFSSMSFSGLVARSSFADESVTITESWASPILVGGAIGVPALAAHPDGTVIGVYYLSGFPDSTLVLVQISADGSIEEIGTVSEPTDSSAAAVDVLDDGTIVVASDADGVVVVRGWNVAGTELFETVIPGTSVNQAFPPLLQGRGQTIYVAAAAGGDSLVARLDAGGNVAWSETFDGPSGSEDSPTSIAACGLGVAVGGMSNDGVMVLKYDGSGTLEWDEVFSGSLGAFLPLGKTYVDCDAAGQVAVAANPESLCGVQEVVLRLYDSVGDQAWTKTIPSNPCEQMSPVGVTFSIDGRVVFGGHGIDDHPFFDRYHARSYGQDGTEVWSRSFDAVGSIDVAYGFAVDSLGNVYMTGATTLGAQSRDIVTVGWTASGERCFDAQWSGPGANNDIPSVLLVQPGGRVTVAGQQSEIGEGSDIIFLRYQAPSTPIPTMSFWGLAILLLTMVMFAAVLHTREDAST